MSRESRGEQGLTTLEWLLIVAAVAGLAALAVVLVQNVVDDTAEQIAGNSARVTAAQIAAEAINNDTDDTDDEKESACRRLSITYSDAFADDPKRTSLWTDGDTSNEKDGGVCGIVTEVVANAAANGTATSCVTTTFASAHSVTDRGGRSFIWDTDLDGDGNAGPNGCVMI